MVLNSFAVDSILTIGGFYYYGVDSNQIIRKGENT
jgi:hypothetical protein